MQTHAQCTVAAQLREKGAALQQIADAIVEQTEKTLGEVPENDCLEYNGELIDAAKMLQIVISKLAEMSEAR